MPPGVFDAAHAARNSSLWTRCIVPDPTVLLPPPSRQPPTWTIAENLMSPSFSDDAFGDGSQMILCGRSTARAAFAVVQLSKQWPHSRVVNCALGPLDYPAPEVLAAELFALLFYTRSVDTSAPRCFYTDCQWVVDSFLTEEEGTARAIRIFADLNSGNPAARLESTSKAHNKKSEDALSPQEFFFRRKGIRTPTQLRRLAWRNTR